MNHLRNILDRMPVLEPMQRVAILELDEKRLAVLMLRPSPIWTYAIVDQPQQLSQWPQQWKQLIHNATPADIQDLRTYGQAPGNRNLYALLETAVKQLIPEHPDLILPIGSLAAVDRLSACLAHNFPGAHILDPKPVLTLSSTLTREEIYAAIASLYPPQIPTNYYIKTVVLEEHGQKLAFDQNLLFKKGETPPSAWTQFLEKRLYRAITQPMNLTPLQIEILDEQQDKPICRRVVNPPRNIFMLKAGFNYLTDAVYCDFLDHQGNKLAEETLEKGFVNPFELPALHVKATIDIAFILDGTLRKKEQITIEVWKPDLTEARQFLSDVLEQLSQNKRLDVQAALCLYGDYKNSPEVKYLYKPDWPFQTPEALRNQLQRSGSKIMGTNDLDYEAALERALRWANPSSGKLELKWRDEAKKFLVVIGYAPPHPPRPANGQPFVYPEEYKFSHEPFTSDINWRQELLQIQYKKIQVIPVWVPPPELDKDHRCSRYSYDVWYRLGEKQKQRPLEGLQSETQGELVKRLIAVSPDQLVGYSPVYWPLTTQIHKLRIISTSREEG